MTKDRRKEFEEKGNQLQAQKQQYEAQGEEIKAKNGTQEPSDASTITQQSSDRRAEISQKTQQLLSMSDDLQRKNDEIVMKNTAGVEGDVTTSSEPRTLVDKIRLSEFTATLEKYKKGKTNLDARIKNNQEWWKLRHYGSLPSKSGTAKANDKDQKQDKPKSVTAWTINAIINKHADYMDNYPEASCLPVEQADQEYAVKLSSVLPAIFERCNYEKTYSDIAWYKPIAGTSVVNYVWNNSLNGGLGDIDIRKCDVLELFWEPGISDIQDSEFFFHTQLISNRKIKNMFPENEELKHRLSNPTIDITRYNYDDTVDTSDHSIVIDVFYHKANQYGKSVLHYCKYVNDVVLFASENMEEYDEKGYYWHGKYPYVFDTMFPVEGSPCGFGYVDIVKEIQSDIDELNDDFMKNAKESARRRYVVNGNGGVNEQELANMDKQIVHATSASLDSGNFKELDAKPLDAIYLNLYQNRINEIKEVSNNRDASSGGTTAGVTAASAIAAMQEAGSKTSRDQETSMFRCHKEGCYFVLELIAQFYDENRFFRITGENGEQQFVAFNNSGIKTQTFVDEMGNETSRKPIYDIKVKPQKRSQYTTLAQNELMVQLYGLGVFDPRNCVQATMLVKNMEFEGKDNILISISQNGNLYQQLVQYQQLVLAMANQLDSILGTQYSLQAQSAIQNGQIPQIAGNVSANMLNNSNNENSNNIVDKAREQARARSEVK